MSLLLSLQQLFITVWAGNAQPLRAKHYFVEFAKLILKCMWIVHMYMEMQHINQSRDTPEYQVGRFTLSDIKVIMKLY